MKLKQSVIQAFHKQFKETQFNAGFASVTDGK